MPRTRKTTHSPAPTTAQRMGSIIKSARDIMRKDKGLSGELDRLPMLTWLMFLKFLDDTERVREDEAILSGKRFQHPTHPAAGVSCGDLPTPGPSFSARYIAGAVLP